MILDSLVIGCLRKLVLAREGLSFSIAEQPACRDLIPLQSNLSEGEALQIWQGYLETQFLRVAHNLNAARALAERRVASLH